MPNSPNMTNLDKWKMIFGLILLVLLAAMAMCIALGKVEEKTSYGLVQVLTILAILATKFTDWAFDTFDKMHRTDTNLAATTTTTVSENNASDKT